MEGTMETGISETTAGSSKQPEMVELSDPVTAEKTQADETVVTENEATTTEETAAPEDTRTREELLAELADVTADLEVYRSVYNFLQMRISEMRETIRQNGKDLRSADSANAHLAEKLADETELSEIRHLLIRSLMATLASLPVHRAVRLVREGAEMAQENSEVALEVFDHYHRAEVIRAAKRAERRANLSTTPKTDRASSQTEDELLNFFKEILGSEFRL